MVLSADATKRQWFYIQQVVRKHQRATVQQHILQMAVLNDYIRYLLMLKDSPKAVVITKKGNIPFGKADLAAIVLVSLPMLWQNQSSTTSTINGSGVNAYITTRPRGY
jgi:hypothetical protein